ncbi:MAG: hypothetical protein ATN35_02040 [Epulopiscium sp. Nele67-Bin004]|nr:MAG: hypothetical protein ATN35_02040 [Epulopiscium sp. Nele67-Bin004]
MSKIMGLEEIKLFGIECINSAPPRQIDELIKFYSKLLEEYCNTKFTRTRSIMFTDTAAKVKLRNTPAIEVEKIIYNKKPLKLYKDYFMYDSCIDFITEFEYVPKGLEIHYVYGFEVVPALVEQALVELIKLRLDFSQHNSSVTGESFGGDYSYTKSKSLAQLQDEILSTLDDYVQPEYEPYVDTDITTEIRAWII